MTTTTFPGPLWFREVLGGSLVLLVALVVFLPLALTSGPDANFRGVVEASGLALGTFGGGVLQLGIRGRQKLNANRR